MDSQKLLLTCLFLTRARGQGLIGFLPRETQACSSPIENEVVIQMDQRVLKVDIKLKNVDIINVKIYKIPGPVPRYESDNDGETDRRADDQTD